MGFGCSQGGNIISAVDFYQDNGRIKLPHWIIFTCLVGACYDDQTLFWEPILCAWYTPMSLS